MRPDKRVQEPQEEEQTSEQLTPGLVYTRKQLQQQFKITDATINTGIFRPKGHRSVWIFITEKKTKDRIPYIDCLQGDVLEMEGQQQGGKDYLITDHLGRRLELLVFHRETKNEHQGAGFRYVGVFHYEKRLRARTEHSPARYRLRREVDYAEVEANLSETGVAEGEVPRAHGRMSAGQGIQISVEAKNAIDRHAMATAKAYFKGEGFDVDDKSKGNPFDLVCTQGADKLYVEVKGTLSRGEHVRITSGELEFNRLNSASMALFVLHSIELMGQGAAVQAVGGTHRLIQPWIADQGTLTPISFKLKLPPARTP